MALSTIAASVSTGVMNSLLKKLTMLLGDEYHKLKGVRNKVLSLHDEFTSMNGLLVSLAEMEELNGQAKAWRDQVREMSYDIEDCIDDFMHDLEEKGATTGFLKKTAERLKKLKMRHQIANKIEGIEARILEVHERRMRYKLDEYIPPVSSIVRVDPRALAFFAEPTGLVGIDGPRDELVELLMDQDRELKVVSIVGFGGLGKTTLGSHVLRKIQGQFNCHAFVSVSLKPDVPRLLRSLLWKLNGQQLSQSCNLDDVIRNIREYLLNKRYFIIIDDIWDISAWEIIKYAFPGNNHGSRVLTTTRIYSVADACCSKGRECVYKMKSLNDQDSRRLFLSRVFGLGEPCPGELEKVSTDILKKCGGVPLAVISISSLLADKPKQTFEFVMNYLGSMFEGNPTLEQMRQILELSYRNLPSHLKTCLLYLGMYPEDNIINRDDLLRQWIAEGFVCTTPRQDAEDVAISYFNELINRSMIQPVRTEYNCEVLSCRLHDIMLDVIRSKIEEDNFIAILNDPKVLLAVHRNIRRVSLQCHGEECRVTPAMVNGALSKVRSVVVFGGFSCPSTMVLKSVRVLHLDIDGNKVLDLTCVSGLSQLRYFKVFCSSTGVMLKLPSHIGKLRQLETFDLRASVLKLPSDISSLPRLSHLIVFPNTVFPDGICRLRSLRSVWTFNLHRNSVQNVEGLGELTNLRKFVFRWTGKDLVEGARRMDVLRCSLERICGSLKILWMLRAGGEPLDGWSTFSPPPIHLREMQLWGCVFSAIPKWSAHLCDLQSLGFAVRGAGFNGDGVAILAGLPSLVYLWLQVKESPEQRVHIPGNGVAFRALKHLKLDCPDPSLTFEAGAMPRLEKLELQFELISYEHVGSAEGLLDGIKQLPARLREIELCIYGEEEDHVAAAKSSLKIALEKHHPGAELHIN